MSKYDICIIGLGYIGLPTACIFAQGGFRVFGYDTYPAKVEAINAGEVNTTEPGLSFAVKQAVKKGKLTASTQIGLANNYIICVPTPVLSNKNPDMSYVDGALESLIPILKAGDLVVIESTVPPGTTQSIATRIASESGLRVGIDYYLAHCPERVLPGNILAEIEMNPRTIGGVTDKCAGVAACLYESITDAAPITTDCLTAELSKLIENSARLVEVSLANEVAAICDYYGADAQTVIDLANRHPRVNILNPGIGAGGHCLPVDPWFLFDDELEPDILKTALWANELQPEKIFKRIQENVGQNEKVAVLGLAYKANSNDVRNSPAVSVFWKLDKQCHASTYDPLVGLVDNIEETLVGASLIVVLVAHDCIKWIDPAMARKFVSAPKVLDCVNALDRAAWEKEGFVFV